MAARNSANGSSSTEPMRSIPALLTSTSTGPPSFTMRPIPSLTDASESTSMAEIVIGSFSCVAMRASSGARSGLRIVAATVWPALPNANAVAMPIPELVPVIRTDAIDSLPFAHSKRPGKQNRPRGCPHSAGFAICSPRGMGEPHDIAPRGSGHLSYSAIWVADGAPLELLASLIHGVPLPEWRTDEGADQRAGGRCADRDDCGATPCVAASAIAAEGRGQAQARSQASREPDARSHQGAGAARATPDLNPCHVAQAYARPQRGSGQEAVTCHRRPEDDDLTSTPTHSHAVLRGDQPLKLGEAQGVEFQPVAGPGRLRNGGPRCEQRRCEEQNEVGAQRGRPGKRRPQCPRVGSSRGQGLATCFDGSSAGLT